MATKGSSILGQAAQTLKSGTASPGRPPFLHHHRPTQRLLRLEQIELDPSQPRKNVGDISDLVRSITDHGLIEPLVVRPISATTFRVIAGERRYQACKRAGLETVPCMVREPDEQNTIEIQLVENLHRKDLDPFEEANGYARLKNEHNYTDAVIAEKMAKSRTHVTQTLSLAKIPEEVQAQCQSSDIALSRDTLYLIAKQPTVEKMIAILCDVQNGVPHEQRRAKARKGQERQAATPKKPKWAHSSTGQKATVVVQSHNSTLTRERRIEALKEALKEAQHD